MIALTGETGAGKSIVLDALGLALGARADSASVRVGQKQADITAEFEIDRNALARRWLAAQDEPEADSVVLRRVVDSGGKSRALINGRPASVAELRDLGALLLELHAQHEHQALLRASTQRELLDEYAGAANECVAVRGEFRKKVDVASALARARADADAIARERAVLELDLIELRSTKPNRAEWDALNQEQSRLSHAKELLHTVESTRASITDDEGLSESLAQCVSGIAGAARIDPALREAQQLLESAAVQLDEAASSLKTYAAKLNLDPERLQAAEVRMSSLFALARKLRVRPEELEAHWQTTEQKFSQLAAAQDIASLEKALTNATAALEKSAAALSKKRAAAAKKISAAVTKELPDLAMTNAGFAVTLVPTAEIEATGAETIEFAFRSHASLAFAPIAKVASGGELARLSLAILVVCGDAAQVPTLVFDEVDVGVGGRVAAQVGRKLQALADGRIQGNTRGNAGVSAKEKSARQVLCVTHMPQVAAHADHHFTVSRDNSASPTTQVIALDKKARLNEISRMLAGHEVGAATEKMAKELLATSQRML